jgi:hypothetical protein
MEYLRRAFSVAPTPVYSQFTGYEDDKLREEREIIEHAIRANKYGPKTRELFDRLNKYNESGQLGKLDLSGLELTSLPDNLHPTISTLICSHNNLTTLPDNLPSLLRLDCSYNRLTHIPKNLSNTLQKLDCSHNELIMLPNFLPFNTNELEYMDFSYNYLISDPTIFIPASYRINGNNSEIEKNNTNNHEKVKQFSLLVNNGTLIIYPIVKRIDDDTIYDFYNETDIHKKRKLFNLIKEHIKIRKENNTEDIMYDGIKNENNTKILKEIAKSNSYDEYAKKQTTGGTRKHTKRNKRKRLIKTIKNLLKKELLVV